MSNRKARKKREKPLRQRALSQKKTETQQVTIPFPRADTNKRVQIVIVPEIAPQHPGSLIARSPQGTQGIYRITFILSIPGQGHFQDKLDLDRFIQSGDSLLIMPKEADHVNIAIANEQETANITLTKNAHGAFSQAQIRVNAPNFVEAEKYAFDLVMPLLSRWSYLYDVALDIKGYHVIQENTDVHKWTFGLVGKEKVLNFNTLDISKPIYRVVFSAYREAISASNIFYQLLCYYKVIEGVKNLRNRRRAAALAAGEEYREPPDESIPDTESDCGSSDPLETSTFRPYLGKNFRWVLDQMRGLFRNAIAHLDPEKDSLIADKFEDVAKCEQAIPVIKYISRVMLRNELQTDPDYGKLPFS